MPPLTSARAKPPSLALAITELPRAGLDAVTCAALLPMLALAPRGDGHPVLVLPGFLSNDLPTAPLREYLNLLGYKVYAWELGLNLGAKKIGNTGQKLQGRLDKIHSETGEKVSVIGWSLGGIMARQLAKARPEKVRQVITLGSPITGGPYDNRVWPLFKMLTGQDPKSQDTRDQFHESQTSPPVPSTAIFSTEDGIVYGRNCQEVEGQCNESIRVYGSHLGLAVNPMALMAIADRLSQNPGHWSSFRSSRKWFRRFFPS